jgi:SAM-dependent methyltransferase
MQELSTRIANLSSEKRRLLEQLLKQQGVPLAAVQTASGTEQAPPAQIATRSGASRVLRNRETWPDDSLSLSDACPYGADVKAKTRRFYDSVSKQLDASIAGDYSFFLNFGYVSDHSPQFSKITLPPHYLNKNSTRLVLELVGECVMAGRQVLDVGCGRGGTVHVIHKFFNPDIIVGMDLCSSAVSFCQGAHRYAGVFFLEGDAENLPFQDESFDVITNVESSHSYPEISAFHEEVYRTLRAGGHFLYTDLFTTSHLSSYLRSLEALGLVVELDRDITSNVLLSCDESARVHLQTFRQDNKPEVINNFLGMPGSQVYEAMKAGQSTYRILRLAKTVSPRVAPKKVFT